MANEINVDLAVLYQKTEWLKIKSKSISDKNKHLISCIDELSLCWSGNASTEFTRSIKLDAEKIDGYLRLIEKTLFDFQYAIDVYRSEEEKISKIVGAIKFD